MYLGTSFKFTTTPLSMLNTVFHLKLHTFPEQNKDYSLLFMSMCGKVANTNSAAKARCNKYLSIDVQYQQGELVIGAKDRSQTSGRTFINEAGVRIPCDQ